MSVELGEGQFDGIEIGIVWWEIENALSEAVEDIGDFSTFVGFEAVGDNQIARPQRGTQTMLEIGRKSGLSMGPSRSQGARP